MVTGSTDGLGYVCAKDIAAKGGHVIVASRNLQKCEKAAEDMKVRPFMTCRNACPSYTRCIRHLLGLNVLLGFDMLLLKWQTHAELLSQAAGVSGKVEPMHLDLASFKCALLFPAVHSCFALPHQSSFA